MRVFFLPLVVMVVFCVPAVVSAGCNCGGASPGSYYSLCGPACFAPPGFCTAPGCCECPPSACDNAWDGYCQHKARWQAYFYQVGTPRPPRPPRHAYFWELPTLAIAECPEPTDEIVPAEPSSTPELPSPPALTPVPSVPSPPIPTPVPEKSTRKIRFPWAR